MKSSVNLYIYDIFWQNRKILLLNFCVLCFLCGTELKEAENYDFGVWGYLIAVLTNHYYILYCLLPIMLIILTRYFRRTRDIEIIRYKTRFHQNRRNVRYFLYWLCSYFTLKAGIVFLIGIKTFGLSAHIEPLEITGYDELLLIYNLYAEFFRSPVVAAAAIIVYFILGFTFLLSVLGYINNRYGYQKVIAVSILVYMLAMLGFKSELKSAVPFICFNNFILLHHGLFVNGVTKFIALLVFAALVMAFCLGLRIKLKMPRMNDLIITSKEKLITVTIVFLLVSAELLRGYAGTDFNVRDTMLGLMIGSSENTVDFLSWLKLTIVYLLPLFFIGISDQRLKTYCQAPVLLRFKHEKLFGCRVAAKNLQYLLLYVFVIWSIGCLTYWAGSASRTNTAFMAETFGAVYSLDIWHIFIAVFLVNLLSDFVLFKVLSKRIGEVLTMIALLLCKFIFYLVPELNIFNLNFGLIDLYEYLGQDAAVDAASLVPVFIVLLYAAVMTRRRFRYGDNTA